MFKRFILIALVSLISFNLWAQAEGNGPKFVIISDIDDTIRVTNIKPQGLLQRTQFIQNLLKNHNAFAGMAALYNALISNGGEVHYVSGAISAIRFLPEKFLQTSGFPPGNLWVRPSLKQKTLEFKVQMITEILAKYPHTEVILVGDNGEKDVSAYHELKKNPAIQNQIKLVLIHKLYENSVGEALEPGQKPYATAAEAAIELHKRGYLQTGQLRLVLAHVKAGLESHYKNIRNRAFPYFAQSRQQDIDHLMTLASESVKDPESLRLIADIAFEMNSRMVELSGSCSESMGALL